MSATRAEPELLEELGGTGQVPNQQEVGARRRRLAAKQARRARHEWRNKRCSGTI
ncbi:MAG: hypothetical protein RBU37_01075 [Myxococcota bacterium]|nr:hypothetical protein [Myxococcota bacterium]